ncbi:hypothetical protein, partial [Armatimonas sp.]|uniref:hypothetical protein n=1 Tax=Armatimonas sp. TaxID=1872638 RepID=UPI00374DD5FA
VQSGFVTLTVLQKPYFIAATQAGLTTIFGEGIELSKDKNQMSNEKRPEWIETAAQAVTELYQRRQESLQLTQESIERGKDQVQSLEDKTKNFFQADLRQKQVDTLNFWQTQAEIAEIIQRHYQGDN